MRDLTEDTLADLHTLTTRPPTLRRGNTQIIRPPANPVAGSSYTYKVPPDWWMRLIGITASLTCSAAAASRQMVLNWLDGDGRVFCQIPLSDTLGASAAQTAYGSQVTAAPTIQGTSLQNGGSQTDPAANTDISGSVALAPGTWQLTGTCELSGTVTSADASNMVITLNGNYLAGLTYPGVINVPGTNTAYAQVSSAGGAWVSSVNAASGAAAVYNAQITATQLAGPGFYAALPDLISKSAWGWQIAVNNMQAADQLSNIALLAELYPSNWADGSLGSDQERQLRHLVRLVLAEQAAQG